MLSTIHPTITLTPAPNAKRCEAGTSGRLDDAGSCGAGQPLYVTNGWNHCEHHAPWPASKEGKAASEQRVWEVKKAGG